MVSERLGPIEAARERSPAAERVSASFGTEQSLWYKAAGEER
jgi:hypothetical protein